MSYPISFSGEYLQVLQKLLKIIKRKELLFFKSESDYMLSIMDTGTLIHISTGEKNVKYDDSEIGISNINEFIDYIKAIDYPAHGNISFSNEKTTRGILIDCITFSNEYAKYRSIVADISKFDIKYDKKLPISRDKDPLNLIATFKLNVDDINRINDDIELMRKCEFFNISIVDDILFYIKGPERQQITRQIDPTKMKIIDNSFMLKADAKKYRSFPSRIFNFMKSFKCDFDVELRYLERSDTLVFKVFGTIEGANGESINIYIGSPESSSRVINDSSEYDFIE